MEWIPFIRSIVFNFVNSFSRCLYSLILPLSTDLTIYCCSVAKSCLTLCDPMDCSTPGFPVLHYLLEFAETHVHWVNDAIQPYYPLSPLVLLPSIFFSIKVFSRESLLHIRWLKYWSLGISPSNEYSGWFRIDWIDLLAVQGSLRPCHPKNKILDSKQSLYFLCPSSSLFPPHSSSFYSNSGPWAQTLRDPLLYWFKLFRL